MGLYDYLTPDELEYMKESAVIDNEALKFEHQFQILALEHETRLHDIDTHALLDNYTEAVLEDAYMAEVRVYEEGVKEAWERFKAWILDIINAILGKTKQTVQEVPAEDNQKKIKLPFDLSFVKTKVEEIANNFKDLFKKDNGEVDIAKVIAGGAVAGVGILGIAKLVKHIDEKKETETTVGDASKSLGFIEKALNKVKSVLGQHKAEEGANTGWASKAVNAISGVVTEIRKAISKVVNDAKEGAKNVKNAVIQNKAENKVNKSKGDPNNPKGPKNPDKSQDGEEDPNQLGNESTNDLLNSMEDISFYEESASLDLMMETVGEEDMNEINSLLESL